MNVESEVASLKEEVARLRTELNQLTQFIQYQPPGEDDAGQPSAACISIRCAFFQLVHPSHPNQSRINIMSTDDGAFIALLGKDEKTRVLLQVEDDQTEVSLYGNDRHYKASLRADQAEPVLELYGKEEKIGVQLRVLPESDCGQVGVCQAGKARAIMKATANGGAISAVHDDGHPRITMVSTENNGELFAVTPDMKVGVKIAADGIDGGFITVNRANGQAGIILSNTPVGGTVIVNDQQGTITGHLPNFGSAETG